MPEEQRTEDKSKSVNDVAGEVAEGIADTIGALLGVGVSLTRLIANVTSPGTPPPRITPGQGPISEMIQYGAAATANVLRLVPTTIGEVRRAAGRAETATTAPQAPAAPAIPTVRDGASLRIPLSIENPTDQPMADMQFMVARIYHDGPGSGSELPPSAIRFEPASLTVAPRDFEKLTVFIEAEAGTAPGRYVATIGLPNGTFETTLPFEVLPASASVTAPGP